MNLSTADKAIARGVSEGIFGYISGAKPVLGSDGKYQITVGKTRICVQIPEDEIDLDAGFVIVPEAVPQPAPVTVTGAPTSPQAPTPDAGPSGFGERSVSSQPGGVPASSVPKIVEFSFSADRNQLYTAWQALANLADLCGKVTVAVKGEPPPDADKSKLENGVYEPLREANLVE